MTGSIENVKAARLRAAQDLAGGDRGADSGSLRRFIAEFYEHAPPSDVAERTPADLYQAARACGASANCANRGAHACVFTIPNRNPTGNRRTRSSKSSTTTCRFSSTRCLRRSRKPPRGQACRLHPILDVSRDPAGRLVALDPPDGGLRESWMQFTITRETDPRRLPRWPRTLEAVLDDVRRAVSDWREMRRTCRPSPAEVTASPPPLPPSEIAEGVEFLRWLDDDNFTHLGFREYVLSDAGADAPDDAKPSLGILADSRTPYSTGCAISAHSRPLFRISSVVASC